MMKMMIFGIMLYMISILFMILSLYYFYMKKLLILEWLIFDNSSMKFNMLIMIDNVTTLFLMIVSMISSLIMFYSIKYMMLSNNNIKRFYYLMMLFIMSMYMLIISPNMLTIILGWDGLGLISFCLIVYYQNYKAMNAGMLTIILNRIGDASLLILMGFMCMFGSWNLMLYNMNNMMMFMIILMILTKSAQMPFSLWLPAAMMAPTPVSSLVHSSTLVTAGVYLMFRYNELIDDKMKEKLMLIFSITMLLSGLFANYEMDLKKIIALSTLSQLSFMLSILSLNFKNLAFFHLFIHAMFKSLMFMCAGSYIHYNNSMQDIRDYNNLLNLYPMKKLIMFFSLFSLMGFPFMLGFYSKDLIMEQFFFNKMKLFTLMNLMISTILTISYSTRMILIMMFNKSHTMKFIYINEDKLMNMVMLLSMLISMMFSKFYYSLNFSIYNLNLSLMMKFMLIKMFFIGMIFSYLNYKNYNLISNKFMMMFKNMNYLNKFFKMLYLNMFKLIIEYELIIEKKIMYLILNEQMNLLMSIINKFNIKKINFYNLNLLMMFLMFLIMINMFI